jgi:hypothetical protein
MRARYIGSDAETTTFGKTFHQWKWVNVDGLGDYPRATLAQNPRFQTDGGEAPDPETPVEIDPTDPIV